MEELIACPTTPDFSHWRRHGIPGIHGFYHRAVGPDESRDGWVEWTINGVVILTEVDT